MKITKLSIILYINYLKIFLMNIFNEYLPIQNVRNLWNFYILLKYNEE